MRSWGCKAFELHAVVLLLSKVRSICPVTQRTLVESMLDEACSTSTGRDGETDSPELPIAVSQGPVVQLSRVWGPQKPKAHRKR